MKVGLLTFHTAYNYGAMLQAYATQEALNEIGVEIEILDFYPKSYERKNNNIYFTFNVQLLLKQLVALLDINIQQKYL